MSFSAPLVSVIIPVYNDGARLFKCLSALNQQTYPSDLLEVIVVDNGSDEDIRSVCAQFQRVQFEQQARPSSYAARNRGIAVASGVVLAFTDSDCIPEPDWIEAGVRNLLSCENSGLVGGRIEVFSAVKDSPTAVEIYEMVLAFPQHRFITLSFFSATANLFTLRSTIEVVGDFRQELKSGGDFEWGRRVKSAGFELHYAPELVVQHPARRTLSEVLRKSRRIEGGHHDLRLLQGKPTMWQHLLALLTTWPSTSDCLRKLRELRASSPLSIIQFYGILAVDRCIRVGECIRLQLWGKSRRA